MKKFLKFKQVQALREGRNDTVKWQTSIGKLSWIFKLFSQRTIKNCRTATKFLCGVEESLQGTCINSDISKPYRTKQMTYEMEKIRVRLHKFSSFFKFLSPKNLSKKHRNKQMFSVLCRSVRRIRSPLKFKSKLAISKSSPSWDPSYRIPVCVRAWRKNYG